MDGTEGPDGLLIDVDHLTVAYPGSRWGWLAPGSGKTWAVQDVSFTVDAGRTLGLIGESGSGKSTVARALLGLVKVHSGTIGVGEFDVGGFGRSVPREYRQLVQLVLQASSGSLNPSMTIGQILAGSKVAGLDESLEQRMNRAGDLMVRVGMQRRNLHDHPAQFSGGERQRIAIARALMARPEVLVLDEAVSNLDVPTQNQVLNLLTKLQADMGLTYVFIAHDLALVRHLADRVAVMYHSRLVEIGPSDTIHDEPQHPYTQLLVEAAARPEQAPVHGPDQRFDLSIDDERGPWTSLRHIGCPFVTRCPHAFEPCAASFPQPVVLSKPDQPEHRVSCHLFTKPDT